MGQDEIIRVLEIEPGLSVKELSKRIGVQVKSVSNSITRMMNRQTPELDVIKVKKLTKNNKFYYENHYFILKHNPFESISLDFVPSF